MKALIFCYVAIFVANVNSLAVPASTRGAFGGKLVLLEIFSKLYFNIILPSFLIITVSLLSIYFHGSENDCSTAPSDCQHEFKNAKDNENFEPFYERCKEVHDSSAFGKRCELCCKDQNNGEIQLLITDKIDLLSKYFKLKFILRDIYLQ